MSASDPNILMTVVVLMFLFNVFYCLSQQLNNHLLVEIYSLKWSMKMERKGAYPAFFSLEIAWKFGKNVDNELLFLKKYNHF